MDSLLLSFGGFSNGATGLNGQQSSKCIDGNR